MGIELALVVGDDEGTVILMAVATDSCASRDLKRHATADTVVVRLVGVRIPGHRADPTADADTASHAVVQRAARQIEIRVELVVDPQLGRD